MGEYVKSCAETIYKIEKIIELIRSEVNGQAGPQALNFSGVWGAISPALYAKHQRRDPWTPRAGLIPTLREGLSPTMGMRQVFTAAISCDKL